MATSCEILVAIAKCLVALVTRKAQFPIQFRMATLSGPWNSDSPKIKFWQADFKNLSPVGDSSFEGKWQLLVDKRYDLFKYCRYNETNSHFFDHQLNRYIWLFHAKVKDSLTLENFEIISPHKHIVYIAQYVLRRNLPDVGVTRDENLVPRLFTFYCKLLQGSFNYRLKTIHF